jgi:hypothetical protein
LNNWQVLLTQPDHTFKVHDTGIARPFPLHTSATPPPRSSIGGGEVLAYSPNLPPPPHQLGTPTRANGPPRRGARGEGRRAKGAGREPWAVGRKALWALSPSRRVLCALCASAVPPLAPRPSPLTAPGDDGTIVTGPRSATAGSPRAPPVCPNRSAPVAP